MAKRAFRKPAGAVPDVRYLCEVTWVVYTPRTKTFNQIFSGFSHGLLFRVFDYGLRADQIYQTSRSLGDVNEAKHAGSARRTDHRSPFDIISIR